MLSIIILHFPSSTEALHRGYENPYRNKVSWFAAKSIAASPCRLRRGSERMTTSLQQRLMLSGAEQFERFRV